MHCQQFLWRYQNKASKFPDTFKNLFQYHKVMYNESEITPEISPDGST